MPPVLQDITLSHHTVCGMLIGSRGTGDKHLRCACHAAHAKAWDTTPSEVHGLLRQRFPRPPGPVVPGTWGCVLAPRSTHHAGDATLREFLWIAEAS